MSDGFSVAYILIMEDPLSYKEGTCTIIVNTQVNTSEMHGIVGQA